ncbi:TPA: hypothetical protein DD449_03915 [Candidatus Berkelbacteria bacterium]|uniref:Uncharacterized protein n=1 Tax=Berkelbacteria bacterium GW2011_GWE1_39_12 TaxID=1618337 RepID=A0A0G4B3W0_9BACT|nr:MAG: hypothetical protein UT28_C0001G0419 [Berkelbacteria bacterium GW2011_GWE1_39_12]HBO60803.1 hypothetical protein [Candidatus Berkelbacteria bacterium]
MEAVIVLTPLSFDQRYGIFYYKDNNSLTIVFSGDVVLNRLFTLELRPTTIFVDMLGINLSDLRRITINTQALPTQGYDKVLPFLGLFAAYTNNALNIDLLILAQKSLYNTDRGFSKFDLQVFPEGS